MKEFIFGKFIYEYKIIEQDRKTLSLIVTPELDIILKCPKDTDPERIEKFLQKKWFWLEKQLSYFKKYKRKIYEKEYVSGESFFYLGRQYKLIVKKSKENSVSLTKGKLIIKTTKLVTNGSHNKKLLDLWFLNRMNTVFQYRFNEMFNRFDYKNTPILTTREMKKRWGSFLNKDKIFLNPKLIHTSKDCIDYVIVHELCHLKYKNHGAYFWKLLDEKYPKWKIVKEKLETVGAGLS
jgi:predicted metal-dependent hydrolase